MVDTRTPKTGFCGSTVDQMAAARLRGPQRPPDCGLIARVEGDTESMTDWGAVLDAVQLTLSGQHELGEKALRDCWSNTRSSEHAQRCVIAHYLADLQLDIAAEVEWDERALAEFAHVCDADLAPIGVPNAKGFAPSLHLNAGDRCLRMGCMDEAWTHLQAGELALQVVERDGYLQFIEQGLHRLRQRLEEHT